MAEKPTYEELERRVQELEKIEPELEVIKADKQRLEMILSSLDTGLSLINPDYTISWVNDTIRSIFPNGDPVGKTCHRFFESSEHMCDPCPTFEAYKSGRIQKIDKYNPSKDKWYSIISQPVKDEAGQIVSVLEAVTEITERKTYEQQILKEKSLLQQVMETSPVGITMVDEKGIVSMANARAEEILGLERSDIYKRRYNDQEWQIKDVQGNEYPDDQLPFELVKKSGNPVFGIKHSLVWPDGKKVLLSINANPLFDSDGDFNGMISAIEDVTERRKAEETLRKKTQLLEKISDNMFDMVSMSDLEGTYTFAGKSHERILGYTTEELIGKNVMDFVHPEDLPEIAGELQNLLETGGLKKVQYRYKHKENHYLWFETIGELLKDENDIPVEIIFSTRDITEQIQAENQLKETRAMFQAALDHSQAGIAIAKAPGGELLYVNESALNIRGADKEKIVNGIGIDQYVSSWQILHFDGTPYKSEEVPLTRAILFGEFCTEEFLVKRPDQENRIVWANAAPIKNDRGEIIYGIVVFLDITDRKKAEQENTVSRMRLDISHRIATMPDATEKDISDFILEKMLDLSGSDIGFIGYVSPDEKKMIIHNWSNSAMAECAIHEKPITFPIDQAGIWGEPIRNREPVIINDYNEYHPSKNGYPEGHVHISRFMAVPVFDGERIVAVSAVGNKPIAYQEHDPRQLMILMESWWKQIQKLRWKKDKETLQAKMSQAQKMESIGSLAGGIAHDFNNILFPIVGLSEMMLADFPPGSPEHYDAQQIFKAGTRGRELVQQILSFSRQSEHQPIPVHIQKILKEVLKLCRATIPADITIQQDLQTDCNSVMADPTQIHQIAMNLITNAYHAVEPAGGTITVKLQEVDFNHEDDPAVHLASGRYAVLSVSDTGTGIDPVVMNKIFDPYFTTKEKERGTGLGLATVFSIVKTHGGDIRVHSDIGKGATFRVYLPLLEKAQESQTEKEMTPLPTGTEHILLVDDETSIVHLETQMLERLGYQTSSFTGSRDALAAFKTEPSRFDLVITDMNMPNMNGMQVAAELIAIRPDIPIIVCTGFSERINSKKADALGIRGLLMKPVGMKDLALKVREVLDSLSK